MVVGRNSVSMSLRHRIHDITLFRRPTVLWNGIRRPSCARSGLLIFLTWCRGSRDLCQDTLSKRRDWQTCCSRALPPAWGNFRRTYRHHLTVRCESRDATGSQHLRKVPKTYLSPDRFATN